MMQACGPSAEPAHVALGLPADLTAVYPRAMNVWTARERSAPGSPVEFFTDSIFWPPLLPRIAGQVCRPG